MHTFSSVLAHLEAVPLSAAWLLEEIAEKRGHQDLFTRQSPEQLKRLREHAMIESAVASNRIEGVEVDRDRVGTILFGNGIMRDRDEEGVPDVSAALPPAVELGHCLRTSNGVGLRQQPGGGGGWPGSPPMLAIATTIQLACGVPVLSCGFFATTPVLDASRRAMPAQGGFCVRGGC